ncbi:MAG: hypothetical protein R2911_18340 [Caldilineaceae bacterium]
MPLIDTPIKRAQFYQLDLKGLKSTVNAISWNEVAGQNKLRHFFAAANWQNNIVSIGVSSSGAKGGAFFLDVQQPNGGPIIAQYVVKGSANPGRTIFAEYILQKIGYAKIPKTLALEINSADPNSEGMVMLSLLRNDDLWRTTANRHRFDEALGFLWDNTDNQPKVKYLVVQKLFGGEQLTGKVNLLTALELWLLHEKLAFNFLSILNDPNLNPHFTEDQAVNVIIELRNQRILKQYAYGSSLATLGDSFDRNAALPANLTQLRGKADEVKTLLNQIYDFYVALGLPPTQKVTFAALYTYLQGQNLTLVAQQLKQRLTQFMNTNVTPAVRTLASVLSEPIKVRNLGRVLAADSLIGNADRLQGGDAGANWDNLFVVNKLNRGPGKVDYPIGVIDNDTMMQTYPHPTYNNSATYMDALLRNGAELDVPQGVPAAPTSNLRQLLTDFDTWFADSIVGSLVLNDAEYQPIIDQFAQAGFPADANGGSWPQVRALLKDGFAAGLQRIINIDLDEVRKLHSSLVWNYGVDSNFDFQALQIRHAYLTAAQINRNSAQPFTINHNNVRQTLLTRLNEQGFGLIHPDIQAALQFGVTENPPLLTVEQRTEILQLLAHLSVQDQNSLIPVINDYKPNRATTERRIRACMCKILLLFLNQYDSEVAADVTVRFANVGATVAFSFARAHTELVSKSKINKRVLGRLLHNKRENAAGRDVVVTLCGLDQQTYWS